MTKILVVEDEVSIRKGLSEILKLEGFEVLQAENGRAGSNLAKEYLPDLIISDILMPEMNGHQLLEELSLNDKTRDIPFVFISALADRDDFRKGMNSGADDYLTKPFSRAELLKAITSRLEKKARRDHLIKTHLNELRRQVITHVPHELLTPLNGIIGFSELLVSEADNLSPDELRAFATDIHKSGIRLHNLIQHYLMYLHLVSDNKPGGDQMAATDLVPMIISIANELMVNYSRPCDVNISTGSALCLVANKEARLMLNELIDNAFKFSESDDPVEIAMTTSQQKIVIEIKNSGRPFPSNANQKIGAFMQFERNIYEQQGAGLGLTISKLIIEKCGGILHVESTPDNRTTVRLVLPEHS